jgi:uncharacterized protein (DUF433 family)
MSVITYPHVEIGPNGAPYIAGTGFKVRMLIEEHLTDGADANELQRRHPQLTLSQIYGALVYYHDHKQQIDGEIDHLEQTEGELRNRLENSATTDRLRQTMNERKDRG